MRANRSIALVVLLTMPGTALAQDLASGYAKPPCDEVDGSAQASGVTAPDLWFAGGRRLTFRLANPWIADFDSVSGLRVQTSSSSPRQAHFPDGWANVDAWPLGERMLITLKSGERLEGAVKESGSETVLLTIPTGLERRISKAEVRQINGENKDTVLDGLLLGTAIGAALGGLIGYDRRTFECRAACSMAIGTVVFTPIGAIVGWLRDRSRSQIKVLYYAP